ncbi:unnamed protein product [Closterium sp. NIES-54]
MASLSVLTFDHEGRPIQFNTWLDDLELYLLSDSRDTVSLFDHTSGASLAPPAIADTATRSQWLTRDAAARLAVRNHLPLAERAHFGQHKTARALYNAVVARYSSPATAALGRLIVPYLFPELSPFATVEDLLTHLRTSNARYRAALPADQGPMYALSVSAEGDCIKAAALGASESSLRGTAPTETMHTFTLDSGASRCFFRDITTLTPLPAPVPVRLADPSGGLVLARSSTVIPIPSVPSGSLSACVDLHVYTDGLSPGHVHPSAWDESVHNEYWASSGSCICWVSASIPVAAPCSCRLLSHQTLLRHHRLGHPSLPRLCGMHSRLLVSGLPRSLPPLMPSPTPPCLPCVEGRQRAAPHSSSFPPTTAPLQTLHMDVWGPTRVSGQDRERYFLLVVDDYTRYTTVFPLRSKGDVPDVLIP